MHTYHKVLKYDVVIIQQYKRNIFHNLLFLRLKYQRVTRHLNLAHKATKMLNETET